MQNEQTRAADMPFNLEDGPPLGLQDAFPVRLDTLLPQDSETGAVTADAFEVYLNTMLSMVLRSQQPLSVIALAADQSPGNPFPGGPGSELIGRAMVRCVRQETRPQDVVGRAYAEGTAETPRFLIVCPLLGETQAGALGERLCEAMTASAYESEAPWLTISVGIAALTLDTPNAAALLNRAQSALLRAQRGGGRRVWRHSETARLLDMPDDVSPADEL